MNTEKSLKHLLLSGLFLTAAITAWGQVAGADNTNVRYGLSAASSLLQQGMYKQVSDDTGQVWKQSIELDQQHLEIIYKRWKAAAADSNTVWIYHIPVMGIDSIKENWQDTTAIFFTGLKNICYYASANGQDTSFTDNVKTNMRAGHIRNLTQRIFNHIKDYQQYHKATRPTNAGGILQKAVYNFIDRNKFNTADVRKLYVTEALFVGKCQLCDGVKKAFWQYLQAKAVIKPTEPDWEIGLLSPVIEEQKIMMEKLVSASLQAYYQGNEMFTEEEVQQMKNKLADERDRSMRMTNNKNCANCDGACSL